MGTYKVEKITTLTDEQYNRISKSGSLGREVRKVLSIPQNKSVSVGDTVVNIRESSKEKDVFKCTYDSSEVFYIVIEPMDEQMALCYSIY